MVFTGKLNRASLLAGGGPIVLFVYFHFLLPIMPHRRTIFTVGRGRTYFFIFLFLFIIAHGYHHAPSPHDIYRVGRGRTYFFIFLFLFIIAHGYHHDPHRASLLVGGGTCIVAHKVI
jgi:hypothetical protein